MEKSNKKVLGIIFLLFVVALAVFLVVKYTNLFGFAVSNTGTCTDSDGGRNYNIKGTCTADNSSRTDVCSGNSKLTEYYCYGSSCVSTSYKCPSSCSNGACTSNITIGSLYATSIPSSASLYVDSVYKGLTPMTISNLLVGSHSIKFTKTGYQDYTTSVGIVPGVTTGITATLKVINATTGSLYATSIPSSASLYVDSVYKGLTPMTISNLLVGIHSVKLTKTGYQDYITSVTIIAGKTINITGILIVSNLTYTCTDSDGGLNYFAQGTAREYLSGNLTIQGTDSCSGNSTLIEYYCSANRLGSTNFNCASNSTICGAGRCV